MGYTEEEQKLHPHVRLPSECVSAFIPETSPTQSTSLVPCAMLAHPRPATGVSMLFDGKPLEAPVASTGFWSSLFGATSKGAPEGMALFDALFSPASDASMDQGTPAQLAGLVTSRVSFLFRGEDRAVPVLIPREQADGSSNLTGVRVFNINPFRF